MSDQLKPCPFCGATEPTVRVWANDDSTFGVDCLECGVTTQADVSREYAIAAWNRRAVPKGVPDLHEAATAALAWIDEIYPADVFDGSSGDEGPVRIVAIRENLRHALQEPPP